MHTTQSTKEKAEKQNAIKSFKFRKKIATKVVFQNTYSVIPTKLNPVWYSGSKQTKFCTWNATKNTLAISLLSI